MKLSVSMIVKNEEQLLSRCLDSVKDADEIVILDTGSIDGTANVARQYGNVNYIAGHYFWNDNFAEARNESLKFCTGDYIFALDADEWLEEGGIQKIRDAIDNIGEYKTIYMKDISFRTKQEHWSLRVWKRDPEIYFVGAVHNYLNITEPNRSDIKVFYTHGPSHQYDPDRSFRILKKVVEDPGKIRERFYLAREYWYRKDYEWALFWYNKYFEVAYWGPEIAEAWLMIARCLWHLQRGFEARKACLMAIATNTHFKEAILFMSEISGPVNSKRWFEFAQNASNEGVLFIRTQ